MSKHDATTSLNESKNRTSGNASRPSGNDASGEPRACTPRKPLRDRTSEPHSRVLPKDTNSLRVLPITMPQTVTHETRIEPINTQWGVLYSWNCSCGKGTNNVTEERKSKANARAHVRQALKAVA